MAFKNLTERFEAQMTKLYSKYSTTDGRDNQPNVQPFIEIKPDNPNKRNYGMDSRSVPINSITTDLTRMAKWSKDSKGIKWYLDQATLQTGNTFGETRLINPLFVIGNTQPFVHLRRPFAVATGEALRGDTEQKSSGVTENLGSAGRLQIASSKRAVGILVTGGKNNVYQSVIKWLPPLKIINAVSGLAELTDTGILGVNERPEFDMDGNKQYDSLYSIAIWNGFQKAEPPVDQLERIANNLRSGNFTGALRSAERTVSGLTQQVSNTISTAVNLANTIFGRRGRGNSLVNPTATSSLTKSATDKIAGRRYFITNKFDADRYLEGTIDFNGMVPKASMGFMDRKPLIFTEGIEVQSSTDAPTTTTPTTPIGNVLTNKKISISIGSLARRAQSIADTASRIHTAITKGPHAVAKLAISQANSALGNGIQKKLSDAAKNAGGINSTSLDNPAEDAMKFGGLSLRQRYNDDERVQFIRDNLANQLETWRDSIPSSVNGYKGGLTPGKEIIVDSKSKYPFTVTQDETGRRRYFFDDINAADMGPKKVPGTEVSISDIEVDHSKATPLVDLYFFDYVNRVMIPFRAYISNINESVSPEYADIMYIGRTERNITYSGVRRDLIFTLSIHAFNPEEMTTIWRKINYLTSLCYPADYSNGFMVPPLIKLTIGDLYNNQPGFIKSLTHTIDDNTPWEITPGIQAPHGITVNVNYGVIEKRQIRAADFVSVVDNTASKLYNFGESRSQVGQKSNTNTSSTLRSNIPGLTAGANRIGAVRQNLTQDLAAIQGKGIKVGGLGNIV